MFNKQFVPHLKTVFMFKRHYIHFTFAAVFSSFNFV